MSSGRRWACGGAAGRHVGRVLPEITGGGLLFGAVVGMGLLYVGWSGGAAERLFTSLLINATVVVGMQIFIGNTGILSFGHIGFGAIAGYTFVLLAIDGERKAHLIPDAPFGLVEVTVHPVAALGAAVAVTAVVAAVVGLGLVRAGAASGAIAPTVITLSLLFAAFELAVNWSDLTGGNRAGLSFSPGSAMSGRGYAYAAFALALCVAGLYRRSRTARLARAVREDDVAARSLGILPAPHQLVALLLSVAVVAVGSSLRVWLTGTISPERFFIDYTLLTITMLVVGGRGSITGGVLGAVLMTVVTEAARVLSGPDIDSGPLDVILRPGLVDLALGGSMLGFMILRPRGLLEDWELADWLGGRVRRRPGDVGAQPRSEASAQGTAPEGPDVDPAPIRLAATGVTVSFGGLSVLEQAHIVAESGCVVGLIGPNGAGKTTLLNALTGIVVPTQGRISLDSCDIGGLPPHRLARRGLARTFQNLRLFGALSVKENVEVAALAAGCSARQASQTAADLLRVCGLAHIAEVRARSLDYGASKRLELARAAALAPRFLLLDEPTSGFSELESVNIVEQIRSIAEASGCGVIVIDHDLAFITSLCDRVYCLDQGSVIAAGSPAEIRSHPAVRAAYLGG
ncbi:ATP-binding cassette domain-containing protein [Candidatus Poriferisodalis multihospitum]|uniref:branched-chain amino acid ABC transporter ATP-binding protein/permease n=1 Tax=Candidatus Poriferisodalis multihospitum TaxID=2983191 RepID=UPI002B26054D|nr:ATP-binding cassette domain-containing protein [Candidatus Poriferisodalis multihospitum]